MKLKKVTSCPLCKSCEAHVLAPRSDGVRFLACDSCDSVYLEAIPLDINNLYNNDNYFVFCGDHVEKNAKNKIGYEDSYDQSHNDAEFYWAFRFIDFISTLARLDVQDGRKCLDIGAATGRLLNVFKDHGYDTYGVELSAPAFELAKSRGHKMTNELIHKLSIPQGGFEVITALEVIEHVENLDEFFSGVSRALAKDGVFLGYFPSSSTKAFTSSEDYHWLHNSFEHLVYPSEEGLRKILKKEFGENIFITTFLTVQSSGVIPNTLVITTKSELPHSIRRYIDEVFCQLNYLNKMGYECGQFEDSALARGWASILLGDTGINKEIPFIVSLLCSKFGLFSVPQYFLGLTESTLGISDQEHLDIMVMSMHFGSIDFLIENQCHESNIFLPGTRIKSEIKMLVKRYQDSLIKLDIIDGVAGEAD